VTRIVLVDSQGPHRRALVKVLKMLGKTIDEFPKVNMNTLAEVRSAVSSALRGADCLILNVHTQIDTGNPCEQNAGLLLYCQTAASLKNCCKVAFFSHWPYTALKYSPVTALLTSDCESALFLRTPLSLLLLDEVFL